MTIVEFYDKNAIENIAGALICKPERVVLVGGNAKQMNKSKALYSAVLQKKGIDTAIECVPVKKNNLQNAISVLTEVIETYGGCVFDITGGEDFYLVALGILMERYKGKIQCHRFNFRDDTLNDCDADGNVCATGSFDISIEDNININGGEMVTDDTLEMYTYPWDFNEDFLQDIEIMWYICKDDCKAWNLHVDTMGTAAERFCEDGGLTVTYDRDTLAEIRSLDGDKYKCSTIIMNELARYGLIHSVSLGNTVSYTFKNEQIKKSLTVAGQALELIVAKRMMELKDKDGQPLYHDVKVGVVIDWDGDDETEYFRTVNEIDVIAMKGVIPIFISCKNGNFDAGELYKLNSVAGRFVKKYAKNILVSTELEKLGEKGDYIRSRMEDMGIVSVENIDAVSDEKLNKILSTLHSASANINSNNINNANFNNYKRR